MLQHPAHTLLNPSQQMHTLTVSLLSHFSSAEAELRKQIQMEGVLTDTEALILHLLRYTSMK